MYFIDPKLQNYTTRNTKKYTIKFSQKRTSETNYSKLTRVRCAVLHHISCFSSFCPLGFNTAAPPAMPLHAHHSHHSKERANKKKVLPRSAAGHSVCVTMVIFNNATSGQSQPQLSRALSQLQKSHTNEGYGKIGQERLRSVKTTPTTNNTHTGTLT